MELDKLYPYLTVNNPTHYTVTFTIEENVSVNTKTYPIVEMLTISLPEVFELKLKDGYKSNRNKRIATWKSEKIAIYLQNLTHEQELADKELRDYQQSEMEIIVFDIGKTLDLLNLINYEKGSDFFYTLINELKKKTAAIFPVSFTIKASKKEWKNNKDTFRTLIKRAF